jgi:hypothetical protein
MGEVCLVDQSTASDQDRSIGLFYPALPLSSDWGNLGEGWRTYPCLWFTAASVSLANILKTGMDLNVLTEDLAIERMARDEVHDLHTLVLDWSCFPVLLDLESPLRAMDFIIGLWYSEIVGRVAWDELAFVQSLVLVSQGRTVYKTRSIQWIEPAGYDCIPRIGQSRSTCGVES